MTPQSLFLWTLATDAGLDGFRSTPEAVTAALAEACRGGEKRACDAAALRGEGRYDPTRPPPGTCSPTDPVACVLAGWKGSRDAGGAWVLETVDPQAARAARDAFRVACEAGLPRGCTELGATYAHGFASYVGEQMARSLLAPACDAGEPEACRILGSELGDEARLQRAIELGHGGAMADRALRGHPPDPAAVGAACDAGSGRACEGVDRFEESCSLGFADACITSLLLRARAEQRDPAAVATELDARCATSPRACREAALLRAGSPVVPLDGGSYPTDREIDRWLYDLNEPLRQCLLAALQRDPAAERWLDVVFRLGADGRVVASWTPQTEVDPELTRCARDVLGEAKLRPPTPGTRGDPTMTVIRSLPLFVRAQVDVHSGEDGPTVGADVTSLTTTLSALGDDLDACVVRHDDPRYVEGGSFTAFATSKGRLKQFAWTSMDVEPEARACLEEVFERPLAQVPQRSLYVDADLHFLRRAEGTHELVIPDPPPPLAKPVELQTLVIVVERSHIDGVDGALGPDSLASVEAVHAELDRRLLDMTRGSLSLKTRVVTWPDVLRAGGVTVETEVIDPEEDIEEQIPRFRLDNYEMPEELGGLLGSTRWDAIFLWAPIPLEDGRGILGTTWPSDTLRGATVSVLGFPTGGVVVGHQTSPPWELAMHELYHQLEARARNELGVDLPSNHALLAMPDGTTVSPRTYVREGTGEAFYAEVLGRRIHPEVWRDLVRQPTLDVVEPGDLALTAEIVRKGGARNGDVLTDGLRSLGAFHDTSTIDTARPSDDAGWWGLRFPQETMVGRIVARLAAGPDEAPSVKRVALEGLNGTAWEPLTEVDVTGPTVDVTLDPESWDGVRVRVVQRSGDREPACAEIEVYPPRAGG